jgi:hypothetical protein
MPCESTYHRFVYRRSEQLAAGTAYHFQTRNLRNVFLFQGSPPDTVMYIVNQTNDIVAYNDDYSDLASEIFYTPTVSGSYLLIIRAYNTDRPGYCDLYRGLNGSAPSIVERDILFWGISSYKQWNAGDVIQTTNSSGDPYMFVHLGNKLYWDDDAGAGLNPRLVARAGGTGLITLGSYSRSTEGGCDLCIEREPARLAATAEDQALSAVGNPSTNGADQVFAQDLLGIKEELEALEPTERERRVTELQQRIFSEEERQTKAESTSPEELKRLLVGPR